MTGRTSMRGSPSHGTRLRHCGGDFHRSLAGTPFLRVLIPVHEIGSQDEI